MSSLKPHTKARNMAIIAATLALALLIGLAAGGCGGPQPIPSTPCPDAPGPPVGGTTNLDALTLSGLLTVDDAIIADGDSDEVQLTAQGHSTQTSNTFVVETSAGTDLFWVDNNGDVEMNGTTPQLTIGDAGAEDTAVVFDGAAQDFYLGLDDTADDLLLLGLGATVGTTGIVYLDENQDTGLGGASAGAKLDVTGNQIIDGAADEVQLTVQGYTTQTTAADLFIVEDSGGTDILSVGVPPAAGSGGDLVDLTDTFNIADGSDAMIGIDVNLTGANHTGSGNTLVGLDLDLTTADANATESAISIADTDWDYGIESVLNLENLLVPSVASSTITTDTTDMFTAGATEVWFIHNFFCNFTTNFDCTGDDCTLIIGDANDTDGLAVYNDGEMQTSDTEMTGAPAGWQGFGGTDTRGAYLAEGLGFVYTNDGIDADFGGTGVQNGSATCYLVYTRLQ